MKTVRASYTPLSTTGCRISATTINVTSYIRVRVLKKCGKRREKTQSGHRRTVMTKRLLALTVLGRRDFFVPFSGSLLRTYYSDTAKPIYNKGKNRWESVCVYFLFLDFSSRSGFFVVSVYFFYESFTYINVIMEYVFCGTLYSIGLIFRIKFIFAMIFLNM